MSWLHLFSARIFMAKAAQQRLAPDWNNGLHPTGVVAENGHPF